MCMRQMYVVLNNLGMVVKGTSCEYKHEAKIIRDALNNNPDNKGSKYTLGIEVEHLKYNG